MQPSPADDQTPQPYPLHRTFNAPIFVFTVVFFVFFFVLNLFVMQIKQIQTINLREEEFVMWQFALHNL